MEKPQWPWLNDLALNKEDFKNIPEGETPLVWGIKAGHISEEAITHWSSQYHQIPAIRPEFFLMGVDFSLLEKFSKAYPWNATCYPIYMWEETLFVACLEPVDVKCEQKICFVAAPYSHIVSAFEKFHSQNLKPQEITQPEASSENNNGTPLDLGDLDFSVMEPTQNKSSESQNEVTTATKNENLNESQTPLDLSFEGIETQVNLALENLDTNKEETALTIDVDEETFTKTDTQEMTDWTNSDVKKINPGINDDYTPLPFLTQDEHSPIESKTSEKEKTVTDQVKALPIPEKHLISMTDVSENIELDGSKGRKGVISHIFYHLKRDYEQLMWIELNNKGLYTPHLCFGSWSIKQEAWGKPINTTEANIFKIAYSSKLPFHGEITDNPVNEKYYTQWLGSQKPNFATIYPVHREEHLYGFIVGFTKGPEFDEVGSLKKIENLVSICQAQFLNTQEQKAA